MDQPGKLAEPTTLAALDHVIDRRNASFLAIPSRTAFSEREKHLIRRDQALRDLRRVRDDESSAAIGKRDFLGGIGLIVRRGFEDEITQAGLALLAAVAATPKPYPKAA